MGSCFSKISAIATLADGPAAAAAAPTKLEMQRQRRRRGSHGTQLVRATPYAPSEEGWRVSPPKICLGVRLNILTLKNQHELRSYEHVSNLRIQASSSNLRHLKHLQDPSSRLRRANEIYGARMCTFKPRGSLHLPPQPATPSSAAAQPPMAAVLAQPPVAAALASNQSLPTALVHRLKATGQQHLDYFHISRRSPHVLHRAAQALR
jgi:hypothetical protein